MEGQLQLNDHAVLLSTLILSSTDALTMQCKSHALTLQICPGRQDLRRIRKARRRLRKRARIQERAHQRRTSGEIRVQERSRDEGRRRFRREGGRETQSQQRQEGYWEEERGQSPQEREEATDRGHAQEYPYGRQAQRSCGRGEACCEEGEEWEEVEEAEVLDLFLFMYRCAAPLYHHRQPHPQA